MGGGKRDRLVELARQAIETTFTKKRFREPTGREYRAKRGVFVTLTKDNELRGCIGYPLPTYPLGEAIIRAARAAAFEDPRFPALEPEELGEVRVEVTILTVPETISVKEPDEYLRKVKVGRDGLIIRQGYRSGLLLPQVPTEYGWNVETFLEQLCMKAGLPREAWKREEVTIESFRGEIHKEE